MGITSKSRSTNKPEEIPLANPTSNADRNIVGKWAVQCAECFKWRIVKEGEYETIRSTLLEDPFVCNKKPNVSCGDPADIQCTTERRWAFDRPNIPKTPSSFKRFYALHKDKPKYKPYYVAPTGKKLRTIAEVDVFLNENPEFRDLSVSNFNFSSAVIMSPPPQAEEE